VSESMTPSDVAASPPAAEPARAALGIQAVLAGLVAITFGLVFLGAFVTADAGLKHDLAEVLKALVYATFGYYFGSSVGSRIKDPQP
jgi:hypothetical protein